MAPMIQHKTAPTAPPILNYLDQPSLMNTPMKEKTDTKKYTPLSKCIFKDMMLENESTNPSVLILNLLNIR